MWECFVDGFTETVFHALYFDFINSWWCLSFLVGRKQNSACHFTLNIHLNAGLFKILRELAQKQELKCGYILPGNKKVSIMKLPHVPSASA